MIVEQLHIARASYETVPAVEYKVVAGLEQIVERQELDTQFVLTCVCVTFVIYSTILNDREDVLFGLTIVNQVVVEIARHDLIRTRSDNLVAATDGVGVEVLLRSDIDTNLSQRA